MKKILLASAIALFAGLNAQTTFGVKAGYALSKLNSNEGDFEFGGIEGGLKSKLLQIKHLFRSGQKHLQYLLSLQKHIQEAAMLKHTLSVLR